MRNSELFKALCRDMDDRFGELDMYRQEMENLLSQAHHAVGTPDNERLHLLAGPMYSESFPNMLHGTVWVLVTSFLEAELRNFGKALQSSLALPLSMRDLNGSWVERFRRYVFDVAKLPLPIAEDKWQDLAGVVEIRNCIVHNAAELHGFSGRRTAEQFCAKHAEPKIQNNTLAFGNTASIVAMGIGGHFLGETYKCAIKTFVEREKG